MRSDVSRENNDKRNMSRKSLKSTKFLEMTVKTATCINSSEQNIM